MHPRTNITFRGFDERGAVRIYSNGLLPHWRQAGCTYFVTFRLADSLPLPVLREFEYDRVMWLRGHGVTSDAENWQRLFDTLPKQLRRGFERRVGAKLNEFLDAGHGACLLRKAPVAKIVADALEFFHGERVWTGDYVVMPNHVHVLFTPRGEFELEGILHSIKSFTANQINKLLGRTGALWQPESYDHIVRDWEQLGAFQRYIAVNPTKASLAKSDYIHSPATYSDSQP